MRWHFFCQMSHRRMSLPFNKNNTILFSMPEKDFVCSNTYQDVLLQTVSYCSMQTSLLFWLFWPTVLCAVKDTSHQLSCWENKDRWQRCLPIYTLNRHTALAFIWSFVSAPPPSLAKCSTVFTSYSNKLRLSVFWCWLVQCGKSFFSEKDERSKHTKVAGLKSKSIS